MKVGILTLPLWHNYGGIIQTYALQKAIKQLGADAVHIDVRREKLPLQTQLLRKTKRFIRATLLNNNRSAYYPDQKELTSISKHTRAFVESTLIPSTGPVTFKNLKNITKNFDAIIVGSDQVWRPEYAPDLKSYFLNFTEKKTRKIAYAASFGTKDWRFSTEQTIQCTKLLKKFNSVSVREQSAVELVKIHLDVQAKQMCDPTILLNAEDYRALFNKQVEQDSSSKKIFTYVLDPSEPRMQGLKKINSLLSLPSFSIMPKPFDSSYAKHPNDYVFPEVSQWLRSFDLCDFVITDSFHGCVFAIIFNKPFVAIANIERGKARFESLLKEFDLLDRLVEDSANVTKELISKPIDWTKVNAIREVQRKKGLQYLSASLLGD